MTKNTQSHTKSVVILMCAPEGPAYRLDKNCQFKMNTVASTLLLFDCISINSICSMKSVLFITIHPYNSIHIIITLHVKISAKLMQCNIQLVVARTG